MTVFPQNFIVFTTYNAHTMLSVVHKTVQCLSIYCAAPFTGRQVVSADNRYGRNVLEADNTYSVPINGILRWLETALSACSIMRLGALRIVGVI